MIAMVGKRLWQIKVPRQDAYLCDAKKRVVVFVSIRARHH
jgi:hypothetical protein